jgi:ABC-type sugar transport system ATPase subunit
MSAVELRKIGKQFPGVRALHDVSLAIEHGEVLGIVGESGAGKSTLLKILGGVYGVGSYRGDVVVGGRVQSFRSTHEAIAAGIAMLPCLRDLELQAPGLGAEVANFSEWLERAPRVLLLDEPTHGADALIERFVRLGHTVVMASSDLPEVTRLADRVLVLRVGELTHFPIPQAPRPDRSLER